MSGPEGTAPIDGPGPTGSGAGEGGGDMLGAPAGDLLVGVVDVTTRPHDADDAALYPDDDTDEVSVDWAWVDEWRRSGEAPAWGPGVAIAVFVMLVVGCAVFVLSVGLADMPWLAVAANVVVAAGLAPALWLCRSLPVLRFLAAGAMVGVAVGWIAALMS